MDANRWYELAQEELQKGKYQDAQDLLENAVSQKEGFVEAHHDLAITHIHQGNFEKALNQYQIIIELAPTAENRIRYAGLLLFRDEAASAEKEFNKVLKEDPDQTDAIKGLGDSYFRQNKFDQAHQQYDRLIEQDPENGFLWYSKAEAYYRAQDHEKSYVAIEKAIELDQEPEFFAFKGDFFIRHDNYERALEQYTLAANLAPRDTEVRLRLGFIFRILDRQRDAIEAFDKALEIDPYLTEALENKIEILQDQGNEASALAVMEQLVRAHPEDLETGMGLARYYMDNNGYKRAAEIFEILIEEHFDNSEVWYQLAFSFNELGEYRQALTAIQKSIEHAEEPDKKDDETEDNQEISTYQELKKQIQDNQNSE